MNYRCDDCGKWFYNCNEIIPYVACSVCGGGLSTEEEVKEKIDNIDKQIKIKEYELSKLKDKLRGMQG